MATDAVELTGSLDPEQTSIRLERALVEIPAGRVGVTVRALPAGQVMPTGTGLLGTTLADTLRNIHTFLVSHGHRPEAAAIDARVADARAGWEESAHRLEEARIAGRSVTPE
jgi:hypothetical protein